MDEFCARHPDECRNGEDERYLNEDAVLRALFMPNDQQPTLDSECQKALDYFKKETDIADLSFAERFYIVAAWWNKTEGLKPAKIREKFRKVVSPDYPLPNDRKSALGRAKTAINRGREFLKTLD